MPRIAINSLNFEDIFSKCILKDKNYPVLTSLGIVLFSEVYTYTYRKLKNIYFIIYFQE